MRSAVLDPSLLHVSENDWLDPPYRDGFLNHLLDTLQGIDDRRDVQIAWTLQQEACLWQDPQTPPWRRDKDWSNQLVPAIYRLLQRNTTPIRPDPPQFTCTVTPSMQCVHEPAQDYFLLLMHSFITSQDETFLCLGLPNLPPPTPPYVFDCTCCPSSISPNLVCRSTDWLKYIDITAEYWPSAQTDSDKLTAALQLFRIKEFPDKPFIYTFQFSLSFIDALSQTPSDRTRILRQMVRRLTLTRQQAADDRSLHDEYLHQQRLYRFRVTRTMRIHYDYTPDGHIHFSSFYDTGQHDEGLR